MNFNTVGRKREEISKSKIIAEDVIVIFLIVLLTKLLALGGPPRSLMDLWEPILSACLTALYSYARLRGIEAAPE